MSVEDTEDNLSPAPVEQTSTAPSRRSDGVKAVPLSKKSKLPIMPLSVLLPKLGELSDLVDDLSSFEERQQQLQKEIATKGGDASKQETHEELMLGQVFQWLSIKNKSSGEEDGS